jgi:putative nucleotidyltransferase with HDIG domain
MRVIQLTEYDEQTMELAQPVYDAQKRILINAKNKINPKFLDRIKNTGISHLIVEDAVSKGITLNEMPNIPTWLDAIYIVKEGYEAVGAKKPLPLRNILKAVGQLISEVKNRPIVLTIPSATIASELKTYAHAVNVALISLQIGKQIGYNELQLRDLALGCILHDIGKVVTAENKKHPEAGFNLLRSIREINLLSAHIAFQHHETIDGKGYPRAIRGNEVHEYAQICGLANSYDNLINERNMPPHEALEVIKGMNGTTYLEALVLAFVGTIPPYPPGTKVMLNNGEAAIITRIVSHMQRPVIRYLRTEEELSLAEHLSITVTSTC